MITDAEKVKTRWKQYFEDLYNDPNPVDERILVNLDYNGDEEPTPSIMMEEVVRAIDRLKTRKAPGIDNITAEEIKAATDGTGLQMIFQLCKRIWDEEVFPTEWKKAVIIPVYKKKDKLDCNNYRGISLLCHSSKIITTIIMERIKKKTEEILSEEQAGFRTLRSTIDQIFTLRQLAEKYTDFSKDLFVCYIDFQKAFDSVWRAGLWNVMRRLGYPEKVVRILESLYKVLEVIMASALEEANEGAVMNGRIINNLRFADDIAALAENQGDLHVVIDRIVEESKRMGMKACDEDIRLHQCIISWKRSIMGTVTLGSLSAHFTRAVNHTDIAFSSTRTQ
ncbi:unnamed protein product [Leuciscus chuanchicus]